MNTSKKMNTPQKVIKMKPEKKYSCLKGVEARD